MTALAGIMAVNTCLLGSRRRSVQVPLSCCFLRLAI